jgi:hypothetical protein
MATGKFHINQADGTVGACRAEKGNCPFGGEDDHYTSMVAAAKAYEDSMADQMFSSSSKPKKIKSELFELEVPENYIVADHLTTQEAAEVKELGVPADSIYGLMRTETGPALTHWDSKNIMYHWQKNYDAPGGVARWNESLKGHGPGDTYNLVREYVLSGKETIYGEIPTQEELNSSLVEKAKKAISAKRDYGFPEDEMTRYNQDKIEKGYIQALSVLSGEDEGAVRKKLVSSLPIDRPHQGLGDEDLDHKVGILERRIATLKNQQTKAQRSRELGALKREAGIRKVKAASHDNSWKVAAEAPGVSQRDGLGLLGVPNRTDLRNMDDATREFWTK